MRGPVPDRRAARLSERTAHREDLLVVAELEAACPAPDRRPDEACAVGLQAVGGRDPGEVFMRTAGRLETAVRVLQELPARAGSPCRH